MADKKIEYRLRIRNAANSADALEVTSVRGGTNPYISGEPRGDGASFDPNTGVVTSGAFSVRIVDPITSGTDRLFSSVLEDANSRQQLGQRRAFIEFREDGGSWTTLYAGRLSRFSLASDIEWDLTVSDWMKAEHEVTMFGPETSETISNFLSRWPKRGCLVGGPIIGGLDTLRDLGGWSMRVKNVPDVASNRYRLEPVSCYGPGSWGVGSDILATPKNTGGPSIAARINEIAQSLPRGGHEFATVSFSTVKDTQGPGVEWPGLVALVSTDGGSTWTYWRPITPYTAGIRYHADIWERATTDLISGLPGQHGLFIYKDNQSALTVDSLVTVRVLTILPSEVSPIYFSGHIVDWISTLLSEADIPADSASLETVRDNLGTHGPYITGRITGEWSLGSLLEQSAYGPCGIGSRQGSDGEMEHFVSRVFSVALPSTTITSADVVQGTTHAFYLDTGEAIRHFSLEHQKLYPHAIGTDPDGVILQAERFGGTNPDPGSIGSGKVTYTVPGQLRVNATIDYQLRHWVDARAYETFDRYGRGPIRLKTKLTRTGAGASAKLGDEFLFNLPQIPNANKRMGDTAVSTRRMQIVRLNPMLDGIEIECIDSGTTASQHGTVPTLTIALSSDRPRNVAVVTITNAATLNGQSAALRLQIATTSGAAPAAEDYTDLGYFEAGQIPTAAYRLPAITANLIIYVRARAEKVNARPSNWSSTANVTLDALDAPSAVTGTAHGTDGTRASATWTNGADATDALVEVWRSAGAGNFASATLLDTLPPASDRYDLYDLAASTSYKVYIRHRDPVTGDVSTEAASSSFTTGATAATLSAPTHPDGFSEFRRLSPQTFGLAAPLSAASQGRYGIVVKATEIPSFVEVQEAVETTAGGGSYGSFATIATGIPSVPGAWTTWGRNAPLDGKRRKLKARHVREGATASAYTSEVIVTPGTNDPIPQFPLDYVLLTTLVDSTGRPVDSSLRNRCKVYNSAGQNINDNTSTAITWDSEYWDPNGLHSTSSNTSRVTVPTGGNTGTWIIIGALSFDSNATGRRAVYIRKNGTTILAAMDVPAGTAARTDLQVTAFDDAPAVGDYYEVIGLQTSGGALNVITVGAHAFMQVIHAY